MPFVIIAGIAAAIAWRLWRSWRSLLRQLPDHSEHLVLF